jgi:superfamily II DNA or RNA helicase
MQERLYQQQGINDTIEAVSSKRKVIRQLPTGGGKTVEFALLTMRYINNTGKSVLILVHREELMHQARRTIKEVCDINAVLITSQSKHYQIARVYIGMVESTVSRLELFNNVGLVIIDECHIANFNKMHNIFLEELIIGYSATPISSNKRLPLNKFYNDIIVGPQIGELISDGYLAQNITRTPKDVVDWTKFEVDKLKGDYNEKQMSFEYSLPKFVINTVKNYRRFCKPGKTLVFNTSIEHSRQVNECFQTCGYNSRHLASDNNEERAEILKWFHDTPDAILNNVMMFTFGFDEPTVRNIMVNFSTMSLPKWLQACGRGSRPIDENWLRLRQDSYAYDVWEKHEFNIIDMGGNHVRFNDWNEDRDWRYLFDNPERVSDGVAPMKTCPDCEGLVHAAVRICPLKDENGEPCLHEFIRRKTPEEVLSEEMVIVTKGIDLQEKIKKNKKKHEYYTFLELGKDVVENMLRLFPNPSEAIRQRYFKTYYDLCKNWYKKELAVKPGYINDISDSGWHIRRATNNFNDLIKKHGIDGINIEGDVKEVKEEDITREVWDNILVYNKYVPKEEDNVYEW